ncbi:hypothetical protein BDZ97DRAFT_1767890 [Flammula alnicola]|nr:hypothetical protein BDZ97DRAFT_1767890 [Flammula alnicola]
MSSTTFGTWSHTGARTGHGRSHPPVERRSSDGEDQTAYSLGSQFMHESYPASSSLTGAMGDANMASHSRQSKSPASSNSGSVYAGNMQQHHDLTWNTSSQIPTNMTIAMNNSAYPGVPGHGGLSFPVNNTNLDISAMNDFTTSRNVSPESLSPHSPYGQANSHMLTQQVSGAMGFPGPSMNQYPSSPQGGRSEADTIRYLQRRVHELEQECRRAKTAISLGSASGLPNTPPSAPFQAQWKARTDARKKIFCSLNRAGNALCSWHDSRRERRVYPPRHAPQGYLNCGCSYDEALFEESLSRHGVGSYHPGENVRMDPALRNPLLRLLKQRYGYKDGDFDHDPLTENWNEGESPLAWEQKAQSGQLLRRRTENAH